MILTPVQVEQWLSDIEARFETMASEIETEIAAEFSGPEIAEIAASAGNRIRNANAQVTDLLAARLRSGLPITRADLDEIERRMAQGLQVD